MIDTSKMSEPLLRKLHDAIREADDDDAAWRDAGCDPSQTHYGTRQYADWRDTRDVLEAEMHSRGMTFDHIDLG